MSIFERAGVSVPPPPPHSNPSRLKSGHINVCLSVCLSLCVCVWAYKIVVLVNFDNLNVDLRTPSLGVL